MPEWTKNNLYIEADADTLEMISVNIFDENNNVSYAVLIPEDRNDPKYRIKAGHLHFNPVDAREDGTCFNWYDFHCDKWGCKWDVLEGDTISIEKGSTYLTITFYSPYEPPSEWFTTLYETFPTAHFQMASENLAYNMYWINGECIDPFSYFNKENKIVEAISEYINPQEYDIDKVIGVIEEGEIHYGQWNIDYMDFENSCYQLHLGKNDLKELLEGYKKQS